MSISSTLDRLHLKATGNRWLWLFSIFCRLALAAGFFPAGIVKILGERFASGLSVNHPMGHYLEALSVTGFYYTFIGIAQIAAAVMLLIPRTVTLGAFIYFPIILNICILTYALRFDGSLNTAPLMTLANLFLLGWNYEKWKFILPFNRLASAKNLEDNPQTQESAIRRGDFSGYNLRSFYARFRQFLKQLFNDKFPTLFFAGAFGIVFVLGAVVPGIIGIKPRNTLPQCLRQFKDTNKIKAGENFCNCIHQNGEPFDKCLNDFRQMPDDNNPTL